MVFKFLGLNCLFFFLGIMFWKKGRWKKDFKGNWIYDFFIKFLNGYFVYKFFGLSLSFSCLVLWYIDFRRCFGIYG